MNCTTEPHNLQLSTLETLAARATATYPESTKVIAKALRLAQESRVTLVNRRLAFVEATTYPGQYYRVEGGDCTCPARVDKCAHRFAVALVRRAQCDEALPLTPASDQHYASLLTEDGPVLGTADYRDGAWQFTPDGSEDGQAVEVVHLTLLGHVALAAYQKARDGEYLEAVRRRFDYGNGQ